MSRTKSLPFYGTIGHGTGHRPAPITKPATFGSTLAKIFAYGAVLSIGFIMGLILIDALIPAK